MIDNIVYNLIKNYSNIWYGIGIAVVIVVLLYGIIAFLNSKKYFSILSFAIGLILLPFLSFQMSRLYGAIDLYCDIDNIAEMTSSVGNTVSNLTGLSKEDTEKVTAIASAIPGVSDIVGAVGCGLTEWTQDKIDKAYTYLGWYIVRRILWSLLFIAIGLAGIILTMQSNDYGRNQGARHDRVSSRHNQTSSRNHRYR